MNPEWSVTVRDEVLKELVELHFPQVLAEEAVDRALEELETRVRSRRWTFESEDHFRNVWCRRARQRAIDGHRRARRPLPAPSRGLALEWLAVFRNTLRRLSALHQRLLELRFLDGRPDREIGGLLWPNETPARAARRAWEERHAAFGELRRELVEAGFDAETLDFNYGPFGRLRRRDPEGH